MQIASIACSFVSKTEISVGMQLCIIVTTNRAMHIVITRTRSVAPTITAIGMDMMESVDVVPVVVDVPAVVQMPISRVVAPIVG